MNSDQPPCQGVSLSPSLMIEDTAADWTLTQVVQHLRCKKLTGESDSSLDCRLFHTTGISLFETIVDGVAYSFKMTRSMMSRWLTYHGAAMATADPLIQRLRCVSDRLRDMSLMEDNEAIARIQENQAVYFPKKQESKRLTMFVYNAGVQATLSDIARVCGVHPLHVAQIYSAKSILIDDFPSMTNVMSRLMEELEWWRKWMTYRAGALELSVTLWESV